MKLNRTLGLATAGIVWLATSATAQRVTTNPTAVPNTVSTPTFSPDTLRPSREQMLNDNTAGQDDAERKNRRDQKRSMRRNKRNSENTRGGRSENTSTSGVSPQTTNRQDGAYRQASMSNGTTNNNSNTTNYNSNNVMTAPTGAGSNPSATGAAGDVRPGTVESGSTMPSGGSGQSSTSNASPNLNRPAATATGAAVAGAENAPITNLPASTGRTTIGDFVAAQPDYTTLQNALQTVELYGMLREGQSYTIFAPSNAAFKKLPAKIQNVLLDGQNRESLKKLLSYHVVSGVVDATELTRQINAGGGSARLKTMSGGTLTAKVGSDGRVMLTDEQGNMAYVDTPDKKQTNGVVHGIDKVLMPQASSVTFR